MAQTATIDIDKYILDNYFYKNGRLFSKISNKAVGAINGKGYRHLFIKQKSYYEHRLIWFLINKKWPSKNLDHIDGNPLNNDISNLRECDQSENMGNSKLSKRNSSGVRGITWKPSHKSWCVRIMNYGKSIHIGYFKSLEEAVLAHRLKFNSIFGEFSKFNNKNSAIWQ